MSPAAKALGLYAALVAVGYVPVVFLGRTIDPTSLVRHGTTAPPGEASSQRTPVPVFDVDLATAAYYEQPINRLVGRLWRTGEVPLWNQHQGLGTPLAAQYSSRVFFPYQILEDVAPGTWTDAFLLGRMVLAGFFVWLWLRRLGLGAEPAFLGGACYALSGTFVWFGSLEQIANEALVLPLLLHALEGIARRGDRRDVAWSALATALVLVAGQPETAFFALAFAAVVTLVRGGGAPGRRFSSTLGLFAVASALGLMLAAPLLLPFRDLMRDGFHLHPPGGDMGVRAPTPWSSLAAIWVPELFAHPSPVVDYPDNGHWDYLGGYTGLLPWILVLAALGRGRGAFRRELVLFSGLGAVLLLKNLGVRPFAWLGRLPLFDQAWSPRWAGPVWTLALAAAAACAAASWADARPTPPLDERPSPVGRWLRWVPAAAFVAVAVYAFAAHYGRQLPTPALFLYRPAEDPLPYRLPGDALGLGAAAATLGLALHLLTRPAGPRPAALTALAAAELWLAIPRGYQVGTLLAQVAPWLCAAAAAVAFQRRAPRLAAAAIGAAALLWLVIDASAARGLPSRRDAYAPTPGLAFLQERAGSADHPDGGRVLGVGGVLHPNLSAALGLDDARFITALSLVSTQSFTDSGLRPRPFPWHALWFTGVDEPLGTGQAPENLPAHLEALSLAGVRWVAGPRTLDLPPPLRLAYDGEIRVFENPSARPRAFAAETGTAAAVLARRATRADVRVRLRTADTVVLTESWEAAWEAEVDGRPVPVTPWQRAFLSVPVAAGDHTVTFLYRPPGFDLGLSLFLVALVPCVILAAPSFHAARRRLPRS